MQDHIEGFNKFVSSQIETITTTEGKVFLSADDVFDLLKHMTSTAERLSKHAPHPVLKLQAETTQRTMRLLTNAIQSASVHEKAKQPSAN